VYQKLIGVVIASTLILVPFPAPSQTPKVLFLVDFENKSSDLAEKNYAVWIPNQIMTPLVKR